MWYGLFCFAAALYVGANGLGYLGKFITGDTAEHLAWMGGILATIFFLPFSRSYPLPTRTLRENLPWVVWPTIIFFPGILWTELFIARSNVVKFGEGYTTATGDLFWFLLAVFAAYWVWSIVNLVRAWRRADGLHRRNLHLILTGILVSFIISTIFDIYMPLNNPSRYGFVGSLFTSVWVVMTGYILVKK